MGTGEWRLWVEGWRKLLKTERSEAMRSYMVDRTLDSIAVFTVHLTNITGIFFYESPQDM